MHIFASGLNNIPLFETHPGLMGPSVSTVGSQQEGDAEGKTAQWRALWPSQPCQLMLSKYRQPKACSSSPSHKPSRVSMTVVTDAGPPWESA